MPAPLSSETAERWQRSWDRLEEHYVPHREEQIAAVLEVVEAVVGVDPVVIDLGCGTGTATLRLLERLPMATAIGVDVDPVLLAIAEATFAGDDRVQIVTADLRQPGWLNVLPSSPVDAVVTVTALHWLTEQTVERLYRDLAALVRPGGVFLHAEVIPLTGLRSILADLSRLRSSRRNPCDANGSPTWDAWWNEVGTDPVLRDLLAKRGETFATSYPVQEFSPPAKWHLEHLEQAGFAEADIIWRSGDGAVLAALR